MAFVRAKNQFYTEVHTLTESQTSLILRLLAPVNMIDMVVEKASAKLRTPVRPFVPQSI